LEAELEVEGKIRINQKYLYENMQLQANKAHERGEEEIKLSKSYLNQIVKYLGYRSIEDYELQKLTKRSINPILETCVGDWYSYVRTNSGAPTILRAPISIYESTEHSGALMMRMKGGTGKRDYLGKIRLTEGFNTVHCSLESYRQEKIFHFVLRLGMEHHPKYLKGVFSGISSFGDPIAGKEILIRQKIAYEDMEAKSISVEEAMASDSAELQAVGQFFERYEGNNIKEFSHNMLDF